MCSCGANTFSGAHNEAFRAGPPAWPWVSLNPETQNPKPKILSAHAYTVYLYIYAHILHIQHVYLRYVCLDKHTYASAQREGERERERERERESEGGKTKALV